jgi:hypothetical protein
MLPCWDSCVKSGISCFNFAKTTAYIANKFSFLYQKTTKSYRRCTQAVKKNCSPITREVHDLIKESKSILTGEGIETFNSSTVCHICGKDNFVDSNRKVRDHCHRIKVKSLAFLQQLFHRLYCPLFETIQLRIQRTWCNVCKIKCTTKLLKVRSGILCVIVRNHLAWSTVFLKMRWATTVEDWRFGSLWTTGNVTSW